MDEVARPCPSMREQQRAERAQRCERRALRASQADARPEMVCASITSPHEMTAADVAAMDVLANAMAADDAEVNGKTRNKTAWTRRRWLGDVCLRLCFFFTLLVVFFVVGALIAINARILFFESQ